MKKNLTIIFLCFSCILFFGCKTPVASVAGNYIYKTECLGNKLDGTIILKAWGNGKNKTEAVKQAKKNAISAVLFAGITDGIPDCDTKPLLTEVNVQKKYETYFDTFFSDKGDYSNFITSENSKKNSAFKPARNGITIGIVVKILKSELREKMVKDGIKIII